MKPGPAPLPPNDPLKQRQRDIIDALRAERIRKGLSQRTVGTSFGAHESSLSNWENDHAVPSARSVRRWCEALDVRVPPDVEVAFRPQIPRCPSRPAYERHRRRKEACTTCREWFTARRRKPRVRVPPRIQVNTRFTEDEVAALEGAAKRSGITRAEVIRRFVLRGLESEKAGSGSG